MILEIQRFADIAPTGLIHKTVCDVSIEGFELPQVGMMTHTAEFQFQFQFQIFISDLVIDQRIPSQLGGQVDFAI